MRIVPAIRPIRSGKILDTNLLNHMIQRTEYGADLLAQYKMLAGTNMFVEQASGGLSVSYLTAVAGGAGTGSGGAGTGVGGEGTGTGGAGTGNGGSGTPEGSTGDSAPGVMASGVLVSANLGISYPPPLYIYNDFFAYYDFSPLPFVTTQLFSSGVYSADTDFKPAFDGSFDGVYVGSGFNLTITSSSGQLLLSINGPKIVNNVNWIDDTTTQIAFGTSIIKAYWSSVNWYTPASGLSGAAAGQVLTVSRSRRTEFGVGVPNQYG
jgi:hypothetical protein